MFRVLIGDDHPLFRLGAKEMLAHHFAPIVVGEAETGQEMVSLARNQQWDIGLMDMMMPDRYGAELLQDLKRVCPAMPVLVVSTYPEELYAVRMFKAGASGYLCKGSPPEEFLQAIKTILLGRRYVNGAVREQLAIVAPSPKESYLHDNLSRREYQIFCLLASGKRLKEISKELGVSPNTVSTYRARILEKMNMKSNVDLTHYAIRFSLVEL